MMYMMKCIQANICDILIRKECCALFIVKLEVLEGKMIPYLNIDVMVG